MQRNNSFAGLAASAILATAAIAGQSAPPPALQATEILAHTAQQPALPTSQQAAAKERAAWLRAGRNTWRPPGYPRPGDSVRQHARKAARRRNQVHARRALRA